MVTRRHIEKWLWLAVFAAVLLMSRHVSVTVHQERPLTAAMRAEGRAKPLDAEVVTRELHEAMQAREEALDRLQEFEEQHLDILLVAEGAPVGSAGPARQQAELDRTLLRIDHIEGRVSSLRGKLLVLEAELIERRQIENPERERLVGRLVKAEAELRTLSDSHAPQHPAVQDKRRRLKDLRKQLGNTARYLEDEEIRRPNPEKAACRRELDDVLDRRNRLRQEKARRIAALEEARRRLRAVPRLRREHRELMQAADRACEGVAHLEKVQRERTGRDPGGISAERADG